MKKYFILLAMMLPCLMGFPQTVTLTFTGRDADNHFIPLNRVVIGNVTQGWQETIYYPDTVLIIGATGIEENAAREGFVLFQNNPNPFDGVTSATLSTSEAGEVTMELADVNGRILVTRKFGAVQPGMHQFDLTVSTPGTCILTARQNGSVSVIKMVNKGKGWENRVEYAGFGVKPEILQQENGSKGSTNNPFNIGDEMIYLGYANVNGTEYVSQTIQQNQIVSESFVLNFNVAAPTGMATVTTDPVTDIQYTTATCGGNVLNDGGYSVIARGVCWSTSPNPVFNDNNVSGGLGLGTFSCQLTNLLEGTTYYVRAYAVNSVGTAYGEQRSFTTQISNDGIPCPGTSTVTDHEGNVYNTVQIGNQCWTKENMRAVTSPTTGTYLVPAAGTGRTYTGKQARWYNDDSTTYAPQNHGLLYNWNAAVDTFNTSYGELSVNDDYSNAVNVTFSGHRRGICPAGWHVPSDAEWTQLTDYVGSQSEYVCGGDNDYIAKALASTTGWIEDLYGGNCAVCYDQSSNNATGFTAVPAGYYFGPYFDLGGLAFFWSASQYYSDGAYSRSLYGNYANVYRDGSSLYDGFSVRCLRD